MQSNYPYHLGGYVSILTLLFYMQCKRKRSGNCLIKLLTKFCKPILCRIDYICVEQSVNKLTTCMCLLHSREICFRKAISLKMNDHLSCHESSLKGVLAIFWSVNWLNSTHIHCFKNSLIFVEDIMLITFKTILQVQLALGSLSVTRHAMWKLQPLQDVWMHPLQYN